MIMIRPPETDKCSKMMAMHYLKYYLAAVVVKGMMCSRTLVMVTFRSAERNQVHHPCGREEG